MSFINHLSRSDIEARGMIPMFEREIIREILAGEFEYAFSLIAVATDCYYDTEFLADMFQEFCDENVSSSEPLEIEELVRQFVAYAMELDL